MSVEVRPIYNCYSLGGRGGLEMEVRMRGITRERQQTSARRGSEFCTERVFRCVCRAFSNRARSVATYVIIND